MIKVFWTPQLCKIEKRTNKYRIDNPKISEKEKFVTFDGPEKVCLTEPVRSPTIINDLEMMCKNIVRQKEKKGRTR